MNGWIFNSRDNFKTCVCVSERSVVVKSDLISCKFSPTDDYLERCNFGRFFTENSNSWSALHH